MALFRSKSVFLKYYFPQGPFRCVKIGLAILFKSIEWVKSRLLTSEVFSEDLKSLCLNFETPSRLKSLKPFSFCGHYFL